MQKELVPKFSIITPIFNEEEGLPGFIDKVREVIKSQDNNFEIIFCNDGSIDGSEEIILKHREEDPRIKLITLSRNFGHHQAVQAGIDHCKGEAVILMDSDFQDPPDLIPILIEKWNSGFEIVFTKKLVRDDPFLMKILYKLFYKIFDLFAPFPFPEGIGIFSLIDRRALDVLKNMPERRKYFAGMREWIGFKKNCVEYERPKRTYGESKQNFSKLFTLAFDAVFSFSNLPLRIIWVLGVIGVLLSFLGIVYSLVSKLILGNAILGWASILIAVLFIGGIQLICLGIFGEYQVRIYDEVKARPYYIISHKTGL
jgi:polyisoprenyl-phosphate glycosyltransferase